MPKGTLNPIDCEGCGKSHVLTPRQLALVVEAFSRGDLHRSTAQGIRPLCFWQWLVDSGQIIRRSTPS